ncbi:hypothetical protein [Cellulomonas sp. ATA003]|nr:hypothetical protein [Cellulomonas sp. ATA003]WNB85080.1 hypothetical protein REH70_15625 [Cellulomonas sp. ATA003]
MTDATNAALQITQDRAPVANLAYTKNWADNGGCTLNIAEKTRGPLQGIAITDNTFGTTTKFNCAILYPATSPIAFARNLYTDARPIKMIKR